MPYRYATDDQDFSDYASGSVLYSQPGSPAFPVRLASEIFQRAARHLPGRAPLTLYDPTCGGAYHLTALGLLHGSQAITRILASDSDPRALSLARRNLGLLSAQGLALREAELHRLLAEYGKASHAEALASLQRLRARLPDPPLETHCFQANALDPSALRHELDGQPVDLVLCDIPYGQLSSWQLPPNQAAMPASPVTALLEALRAALSPETVIAIAADKAQKLAHPAYQRLERFQIGKRQISIFRMIDR